MRLTIAYSQIKKRNLVLINNATYQRETLSERSIRQPLSTCRSPTTKYVSYAFLSLTDSMHITFLCSDQSIIWYPKAGEANVSFPRTTCDSPKYLEKQTSDILVHDIQCDIPKYDNRGSKWQFSRTSTIIGLPTWYSSNDIRESKRQFF